MSVPSAVVEARWWRRVDLLLRVVVGVLLLLFLSVIVSFWVAKVEADRLSVLECQQQPKPSQACALILANRRDIQQANGTIADLARRIAALEAQSRPQAPTPRPAASGTARPATSSATPTAAPTPTRGPTPAPSPSPTPRPSPTPCPVPINPCPL